MKARISFSGPTAPHTPAGYGVPRLGWSDSPCRVRLDDVRNIPVPRRCSAVGSVRWLLVSWWPRVADAAAASLNGISSIGPVRGPCVYLRELFRRWSGFFGWTLFHGHSTGTIAAVSSGFSRTLAPAAGCRRHLPVRLAHNHRYRLAVDGQLARSSHRRLTWITRVSATAAHPTASHRKTAACWGCAVVPSRVNPMWFAANFGAPWLRPASSQRRRPRD